MLPTVGADSVKIIRYAGEVAGRIQGIAAVNNLVPDASRRADLVKSSTAIITSSQSLQSSYIARIQFEEFDYRIVFGKGKGVDRGFDAIISIVSESVRTSLPDRTTSNPDYRAIFPNGAEAHTSPTIRDDHQIGNELRTNLVASNLPDKTQLIALLDDINPALEPAANALTNGEEQIKNLFQHEMNARKTVVDTLWEQRKIVETILGRGGKTLARFVFFDFRKSGDSDASPAPQPDPNAPQNGG